MAYANLDAVKAVTDPVARATAAREYLDRLTTFRDEALAVRDAALRDAPGTAPDVARATGWSVGTVKFARRTIR
jgi:hypothetical protein